MAMSTSPGQPAPAAPPRQSASLAALAVSLAYQSREDRACTRELLADAPAVRELHAARSLLRRWRLEDPERQHRAVQLLDRALAQTEGGAPGPTAGVHDWVTEWSQ